MGFASGGGSKRDDEGSSGAERGGFGGWGGSRNEFGGGGDNRDKSDWSDVTDSGKASEKEAADKAAADKAAADKAAAEEAVDTRSYMSRLRSIFGVTEGPGEMTDEEGNVVAESFAIERPADIQTVELGDKTAYESVDAANPYESYAKSVVEGGLVGDEQKEKDLAKEIADAGRVAQAADVASTFGSAIAGPIGAVPGLVHSAVTGYQDDPVQQAGQSLYEGGKVDVPGVSTAIGSVFGGLAGSAYDVANEVFGGSRQLGAFEEAAGIERDSVNQNQPNDNDRRDFASTSIQQTPAPAPTAPATMADSFQMSSLGTNVYSDFLDNFFKQG